MDNENAPLTVTLHAKTKADELSPEAQEAVLAVASRIKGGRRAALDAAERKKRHDAQAHQTRDARRERQRKVSESHKG